MTDKKSIKWPKGCEGFYTGMTANRHRIMTGTMISIDPSSGGTSMPGYAIYKGGVLISSGTIRIPKAPTLQRLQTLYDEARKLVDQPDVLAIELIRGGMASETLKWAVGVTLASIRAPILLEVPIVFWKAAAGKDWKKSDAADAEMIGASVIMWCKEQNERK